MKIFWTTLAVVAALLVQSGLSQVLPPAAIDSLRPMALAGS